MAEEFRPNRLIKFEDIIQISAKKRENTNFLQTRIRETLDQIAEEEGRDADEREKQLQLLRAAMTEHIDLNAV